MKQIIEIRSELGAGTRGASLGIDAVKIASIETNSDFFIKYPILSVEVENHLLLNTIKTPNAKNIEGIVRIYNRVSEAVNNSLVGGYFPVILAADHSSAGACIAGVKKAFPNLRIGVVWVDAHADLHSPYTTHSGNIHGMPLATALNEDNIESKRNNPPVETIAYWEQLKNMAITGAKLNYRDLVYVALRDFEQEEQYLIEKNAVKCLSVDYVRKNTATQTAHDILVYLDEVDIIYLSFDVDSLDAELVSKGTGTPVKNGLLPSEAIDLMQILANSGKLVAFELVEVNPLLDNEGNAMGKIAFDILEKVVSNVRKPISETNYT